jgi:hypothetical protein
MSEIISLPLPNLGNIDDNKIILKCSIEGCLEKANGNLEGMDLCFKHSSIRAFELANEYKNLFEKNKMEQKQQKEQEKKKAQEQKEEEKKIALETADNEYEIMKLEFEKNNFQVGTLLCNINDDGEHKFYKIPEAAYLFEDKIITTVDKRGNERQESFYPKWRKDETKRKYQKVGFYSDINKCPSYAYNMFKGFKADKLKYDMTEEQINEKVQPILELIDYLTGGFSSHLLKWLAKIIQDPLNKPEILVLLRDVAGLFMAAGGTGKNMLIEWFGNEIIGEEYFYVISNNKELYGDFNGLLESKILIFIEEANGSDNHSHAEIIKTLITKKKMTVNKKNIEQYQAPYVASIIAATNKINAFPICQDDRRTWAFDVNKIKRGNSEYFKNIFKHLHNEETKYAFFQYLKKYETFESPIDFQNNIPETPAYCQMRKMNAPVIEKWLGTVEILDIIENKHKSRDLFNIFINWCITENKNESAKMNLTNFTQTIKNAPTGFKITTVKGYTTIQGVRNEIIENLKDMFVLDRDFTYFKKEDRIKAEMDSEKESNLTVEKGNGKYY